jgi:hypothetical protein
MLEALISDLKNLILSDFHGTFNLVKRVVKLPRSVLFWFILLLCGQTP